MAGSTKPLANRHLVNVHQAKTHLSQLLQDVEPTRTVSAPGAMRGRIKTDDAFDAPLDGLFEALQ